ncbi:MAG TPA: MATE family efflux transporter [Longimicrobiales bacterium]
MHTTSPPSLHVEPNRRGRRAARRPARARRARLFRHELRTLLAVAGPIIISQLGTIGMTTVDTLMVGPLGATALAAAAVGAAIHTTVLMVCTGVVLGMTPLVSQAFGAGDRAACRRVLVQGLWLALALSIPLAVISLAGGPLARLLDQDPAVAKLAGGYTIALALGAPPALLFMAVRQFLEGMGLSRPPMATTLGGLGLNALFNGALIYGIDGWIPAMGVVGSGWATTLVRWAMLLGILGYLAWNPELHPFRGVHWRPRAELLRRIARIGAPAGAQMGLEVGIFALAAVMMGWLGPVELAAHEVTLNIGATTFMVALGASMAGSIRVGHHIGARNRHGVRRAITGTYLLTLGFMGCCALLFVAAPDALVGLYTDDRAIIHLGASLLLIAALFQLFDGGQVAGINLLRGAADTRTPMLLAALGYWGVGLPVAYGLGFHTPLGPRGIWTGLALALGVVAVLMGRRVRRVLW